jgi:hypothetical protein
VRRRIARTRAGIWPAGREPARLKPAARPAWRQRPGEDAGDAAVSAGLRTEAAGAFEQALGAAEAATWNPLARAARRSAEAHKAAEAAGDLATAKRMADLASMTYARADSLGCPIDMSPRRAPARPRRK